MACLFQWLQINMKEVNYNYLHLAFDVFHAKSFAGQTVPLIWASFCLFLCLDQITEIRKSFANGKKIKLGFVVC